MNGALLGLYERMKKALKEAGGFDNLSDEQRDLFNNAIDLLMSAKFDHGSTEQAEEAVTAFLDSLSPTSEPIIASLIRVADYLDQNGHKELANKLDAFLKSAV